MITDFADRCTDVSVLVDDRAQAVVAPHEHRPGARSACRARAVSSMTLVAELLGLDKATTLLAYGKRNHQARFS